jgi:hypothetical protein
MAGKATDKGMTMVPTPAPLTTQEIRRAATVAARWAARQPDGELAQREVFSALGLDHVRSEG